MPGELDNALTRAFDAILYATWYRGQRQAVLLKEGKSATSAATALFARTHTHTYTHARTRTEAGDRSADEAGPTIYEPAAP